MQQLYEYISCRNCGFDDPDRGCTCPSIDRWFACPVESEKPECKKMLEDYIKWAISISSYDEGER